MMKHILSTTALLGLLSPGCVFIDSDAAQATPTGFLELDWSLQGSKNPDQCDVASVQSIDILITTTSDEFVTDVQDPARRSSLASSCHRTATS